MSPNVSQFCQLNPCHSKEMKYRYIDWAREREDGNSNDQKIFHFKQVSVSAGIIIWYFFRGVRDSLMFKTRFRYTLGFIRFAVCLCTDLVAAILLFLSPVPRLVRVYLATLFTRHITWTDFL